MNMESSFNPQAYLDSLPSGAGKKVAVGLSGGVDSAVTLAILKAQGYEVLAVHMVNWQETEKESGYCTAQRDQEDAVNVAEALNCPYYIMNFSKEYQELVFKRFLEDYQNGLTPNPDIFCNKEIKFHHFYQAVKRLGMDYVATGHYARILQRDGDFFLGEARDENKDQTYFLGQISISVLKHVLFPLGDLTKPQVRMMAEYFKIPVAKKKDSTGICFIGERPFREFLSQYISAQKGPIKDEQGEIVGTHEGLCFYTLGQRKGLGLGGEGLPWFVASKDLDTATLHVVRGEDHPSLYRMTLTGSEVNQLVSNEILLSDLVIEARVRYRQKKVKAFLEIDSSTGEWKVRFDQPVKAMTPGQFVVLYRSGICLGSAYIRAVGPNLLEQGWEAGQNLPPLKGPSISC
jgi:tRNA-specific 2-thiouridylase